MLTPVAAQSERFFDILEKNTENTQKGHLEAFFDPWLALASL